MTIPIYDPGLELTDTEPVVRQTAPAREGSLGILDNGKPNFDELMRRVVAHVESRHPGAQIEYRRKLSASHPVAEADVRPLAENCGLVFTGSAD